MRSTPGGMIPMTSGRWPSTSTSCPTIGLPPKAVCHSSCERMAMGGGSGLGSPGSGGGPITSVSPSRNKRPSPACTPRALSRCASTDAERTRRERSPAVRFTSPVLNAPTAENDRFISRNSRYSGAETQKSVKPSPGNWVLRYISCWGLGYLRGSRITPFTIEKMAVFAPMPSANVAIAVRVKTGLRRSILSENLRSLRRVPI